MAINLSTLYTPNSNGLLSTSEQRTNQYKNALLNLGSGLSKVDANGNLVTYNPTGSVAQAWDAKGNRLMGDALSSIAANPVPINWDPTAGRAAADTAKQILAQQGVATGLNKDAFYNASPQQLAAAMNVAANARASTVNPTLQRVNTVGGQTSTATQQLAAAMNVAANARASTVNPTLQRVNTVGGQTSTATQQVPTAIPQRRPDITLDPRSGILYGAGNTNISDEQIRNFIGSAKTNDEILNAAVANNVSIDQISRAMGGQGGFSNNGISQYLASKGILRPSAAGTPKSILDQGTPGGQFGQLMLQEGQLGMDAATAAYINLLQQRASNADSLNLDISNRLQQALQPNIDVPPQVSYTPFQAQQTQVTPNMTVRGQLEKLLDPNSTLMIQARTQGIQDAARRYLLNSSLAATAGEDALIRQALNIATPDAETFNRTGLANTHAANQIGLANAQNQLQASQINATNTLQRGIANAELGAKVGMFNADLAYRGLDADANRRFQNYQLNTTLATDLFGRQMDNDNRLKLQEIEQRYQKDIQGSLNASNMYNSLVSEMGRINAMDVPGDAKQSMLNNLLDVFDSQMNLQGSILDVVGLKNPQSVGSKFKSTFKSTSAQTPGATDPQFKNPTTGEALGQNPSQPTEFNTVGGSISTELARNISSVLKIDPRFVVTIQQKQANKNFDKQVEQLVQTGQIEKISLEKYIGQTQGGVLGGSKKINDPLAQIFRLAGGHIYYDYGNVLGRASPIGVA